jgi:hypothetical protein
MSTTWTEQEKYSDQTAITYNEAEITYNEANYIYDGKLGTVWTEENES